MTYKSDIGKYGEDKACEYLVKNGYKIIERNYRKPWGELDIIAKSPEGILVFVEVKTMRSPYGRSFMPTADLQKGWTERKQLGNEVAELLPEEQMTSAKIKKFKRTAALYAQNNEKLINNRGWRCDVITLTISEKDDIINYYENV